MVRGIDHAALTVSVTVHVGSTRVAGGERRGFQNERETVMIPVISGFGYQRVHVGDGVHLNAAVGGSGGPVVLLHGFPQTHLMWRHVAAPGWTTRRGSPTWPARACGRFGHPTCAT